MTWLSRLKKISTHPETGATKPTKPGQIGYEGGFVGFVASVLADIQIRRLKIVWQSPVPPRSVSGWLGEVAPNENALSSSG